MAVRSISKQGILAALACAALLFSACFGGGSADSKKASTRPISVYSEKLDDPIIPSMANHYYTANVVRLMFAGLVYTDEKGEPQLDVAKSIESSDNKVWTITLREDSFFTDGEQVTADSFINAWNYAADIENKQKLQDRFKIISGYDEGKQKTLSGIKATGKFTIEVTLNQPNGEFRNLITNAAFYPLPAAALKDMKAFEANPFGNGPYQLKKWDKGIEVLVEKNPDYKGPRQAENDGISFKIYAKDTAAYSDILASELDLLTSMPVSALGTYKSDLGEGRYLLRAAGVMQYLVIPYDVPGFSGDEGRLRRQALSRAINREEIVDKIYQGVRGPAKGFIPEFFSVYDPSQKSPVFDYDPQAARELWEKANAISPYSRKIELYYNSDGPYAAWFEAMSSQLKEALGVEVEAVAAPSFRAMRSAADNAKQPVRLGYFPDYARPSGVWIPMFFDGGSGNWTKFKDPEFEQLVREAQGAASFEESKTKYNQARSILARELPAIPVLVSNALFVWSERLDAPLISWEGSPVFHKLKTKK